MPPTRWDAMLFARAAGMALLALAVALLVTAATDEGGVSWLGRAGRTLPLAPLCSALGAWVAIAPTLVRGEVLALQTLGRSPAQIGAAPVAGAALVAVLISVSIAAVRAIDLTGFFPVVTHPSAWHWEDGVFVDDGRGLAVLGDGALRVIEVVRQARGTPTIPPLGRASAAMALAFSGLAFPLRVAHAVLGRRARDRSPDTRSRKWAFAASVAAAVGSVLLFRAAAARLVPALARVRYPLLCSWRARSGSTSRPSSEQVRCWGRGPNTRDSSLVLRLGRGLAVDRVLQAAAQSLRALDPLALERRSQPLVTLPHAPDRTVCHVGARNLPFLAAQSSPAVSRGRG